MKNKFLQVVCISLMSTFFAHSQEAHSGFFLGINGMRPNHSDYSSKLGFQGGVFFEKEISSSFAFQKEVFLSRASFDFANGENTTYSLGVPLYLSLIKLNWIKPYLGAAAVYNFSRDTKYDNTEERIPRVSDIQVPVLAGFTIPFSRVVALDFKFMGTIAFKNSNSLNYNGGHLSLKYKFPLKE